MFCIYGIIHTLNMCILQLIVLSHQNYKSCFEVEHGNLGDLDEPYEILNHSGINSIIWPQYHTGIYMFKLKIVDPNFRLALQ